MTKTRASFVICAAIALAVGLAGIVDAITNGELDGNRHPYVAMVDNGTFTCSGVALSESVLVTAAHCLWPWQAGAEGRVRVTFDAEADLAAGTWYEGTIHSHPDWCIACRPGLPSFDTHDIAVVVLDDPVTLPTYGALPAPSFVESLPMKTALEVVGYGIHGWGRGGGPPGNQPIQDFKRYFAATQLVASENRQSDEYIKLTANPAQGKGGVCFGDSGGPALLGNIVLGLTSYLPNSQCAGVTYSNRLDLPYALEFINSF
jgi:hypothetical protein